MSKDILYKTSETIIINRSEINLHPQNPKDHTNDEIKERKKNIQKVALMGGIRWNATTGNLIDGHGNIAALDLIHKYNETKDTDYKVKVEKVELDEKTEKEQLLYLAKNRELNPDKVIMLLPEIDYNNAGLEMAYLNAIGYMDVPALDTIDIVNDFIELEKPLKEKKEEAKQAVKEAKQAVKEAKQAVKDKLEEDPDGERYVILRFESYQNKVSFMDMLGELPEARSLQGERVASMFI